eukprot:symbB.v1.2.000141.t1/scaffold16.1/size461936/15
MLKRFFERAGSVRRLRIFQENGQSRGMGLCEYMTPEAALVWAPSKCGQLWIVERFKDVRILVVFESLRSHCPFELIFSKE